MDHIYPTKDYKVYKIKDEVIKLQNSLQASDMPSNFSSSGIASKADISEEEMKIASVELCHLYENYGNQEESGAPPPFSAFSEEALQLNCVKMLREGSFEFKEPRVKEPQFSKHQTQAEAAFADIEPYKEAVITIRFYEPFNYTPSMKNQPRFHQEYHVLGSNFLTDLRDGFYCHCNYGPFFDISDDPHSAQEPDPEAPNPAFFFIHDTFYNDVRNPANPDYSQSILNYYKRFSYIREFKTARMEQTKFEDLQIRVGYPCVYQHHGACEHIFCITSVDLIDKSNSLVRSDYPLLASASRKRSMLCDICGQNDASYLVTNCALHVKDPMRVCYNCFIGLHYRKIGNALEKTCDFRAYKMYSWRPENL